MYSLGPLTQIGLVVPDLDAAIEGFVARGVGPFFEMRRVPLRESTYRGRPTTIDMSVAIAYSGEIQVEIITSRGDAPSVYADFLTEHPSGGLHHLAYLSDAYDEVLGRSRADGTVIQEMTNTLGARFAYLERDPVSGAYVEILESNAMLQRVFAHIRAAATSWDGSAPRRTLGG